MPFEAAKCFNCGALIQVPSEMETASCMYCGSKIIVKEAVQRLEIEFSGSLIMDTKIQSMLKSAEGFIKLEKWIEAKDIYTEVSKLDSTDYRAWWGLFLAETFNLKEIFDLGPNADLNDAMRDAKIAIDMAPDDVKSKLYNVYFEYHQKSIETVLKSAENFMMLEKWTAAKDTYALISKIDSTDYRTWWGLFLVGTLNLKVINDFRINEDLSNAKMAIDMAPDDVKNSLSSIYYKYLQECPDLYKINIEYTEHGETIGTKIRGPHRSLLDISIMNSSPISLSVPAGKFSILFYNTRAEIPVNFYLISDVSLKVVKTFWGNLTIVSDSGATKVVFN